MRVSWHKRHPSEAQRALRRAKAQAAADRMAQNGLLWAPESTESDEQASRVQGTHPDP